MKSPNQPRRLQAGLLGRVLGLLTLTAIAAAPPVHADSLSIAGRVLSAGGEPVAGALVQVYELRTETTTDDDGFFVVPEAPPGDYLIEVSSDVFGGAVLRVAAVSSDANPITITLDKMVHSGAVSVTAAGVARGLSEIAQPVDVLAGDDLVVRRQSSLGETLAQQPGIAASSYGQGSSRPIIRGLGQDRIRILENGLDSGDVSSIGPDHAVAMDSLTVERIEVVRGPAAVLWGSNAIGGAVNLFDGRVPNRPATQPLSGVVELEAGSNSDKKAGAAKVEGGRGRWAWHLDFLARDQDNYSSPAPRENDHESDDGEDSHHDENEGDLHDGEGGEVDNSWTRADGGTVGASYVTERGFIGLAFSRFDTKYGIPGHHEEHGEDEAHHDGSKASGYGDGVHSDLEQRRIDLHSQLDEPFRGFSALRFSAGFRDYQHEEIEDEVVGTRFSNRWTELRLDLVNRDLLGLDGTVGLQVVNRDFSALGSEAFVQPNETRKLGLYAFERTGTDRITFELGLRHDSQRNAIKDPALPDRQFSTWTASAGLVWRPSPAVHLAATVNRPERPPTAEELYSDGPHAATGAYEIGDPGLEPERGGGLDVSLGLEFGDFELTFTGFVNRWDRFIYLADTDETVDGLAVRHFAQADAEFEGFEVHGHYEVLHTAHAHLHIGLSYDRVEATFSDSGEDLPRIPPRRFRLAIVSMGDAFDARIESWWVAAQDRTAAHESRTPGYDLVNASFGYKVFAGRIMHHFMLRGRNLFDSEAYNHTSYLKFEAPLPGRDLSLVYRLVF